MSTKPTTRPLILLTPTPTLDALAATYALAQFFIEHNATPSIVCRNVATIDTSFLVAPTEITPTITGLQDFIIQFDTTHNTIRDVTVKRTDTDVQITVTPTQDFIDPRDFSFAPSQIHYDAVFIIGKTTIADTQTAQQDQIELLASLPQQSFVATKESPILSMQLYTLLTRMDHGTISGTIAQNLLTGIVASTDGLRSERANATVFHTCSALMRNGADLQSIMTHLYKTVSFTFLHLWGGLLEKLSISPSGHLASAIIEPLYGADHEMLAHLLTRTAQFLPNITLLAAFWHDEHTTTRGMILPTQEHVALKIPSFFTTVHNVNTCVVVTTQQTPETILHQLDTLFEEHKK